LPFVPAVFAIVVHVAAEPEGAGHLRTDLVAVSVVIILPSLSKASPVGFDIPVATVAQVWPKESLVHL